VLAVVLLAAAVGALAFAVIIRSLRSASPRAASTDTEARTEAQRQPERLVTRPFSKVDEPGRMAEGHTARTAKGTASEPESGENKVPPAQPSVPGFEAAMEAAMKRAQNCHRGGRANGTAEIIFTLTPQGHAKDVRLEGEPIASAPVGRCVIAQISALLIPKFEGPALTVRRSITLQD
jgi:hypothetical protein